MPTDNRPNFVFIMTDTQGANVIGAYGTPGMQTPCIDKLAAEGVRFTRAYDSCPICTPARGAIFTGLYPHTNGAWANELPLYTNAKTMGQRFQDAGYETVYLGKWHLSGQDYFDQGYAPDGWSKEWWYDGRNYMDELSEEDLRLWREVLMTTEALLEHRVTKEFTWGHRISQRAIKFLKQKHDKPFVLVLSYDEPHGPCTCPPEYVERFLDYVWDPGPNKNDDLKNKTQAHRDTRDAMTDPVLVDGLLKYPPYFACNSFVDSEIGSVIDAVDAHAPKDTVVMYTSDHGQQMGAHGLISKGVLFEESIHIPLVVRMPGGDNAGRVEPTLANHVDIVPTMLDLAGLPVPPIIEGTSLAPILLGGQSDMEKISVTEWNRDDIDVNRSQLYPARTIHHGRYKLTVNLLDTDEMYDLEADPYEMDNVIERADLASVRDDLHDRLLAWMNDTRDPFRGPGWARRYWRTTPCPDALYTGGRGRPDDGYSPPTLEYWTGKPAPATH